jgi:hypothetical protein
MEHGTVKAHPWMLVLLTGLSVSIGWGVRGQFGHEYGACLAGAFAGLVVALLSGRPDWWRRVHYFAALGAIGFGFGGAMSYMKTVAYTHSSDSMTVLYGFACLFVLGFIWSAPCGAGLALSAYLDREELTKSFVPLSLVFAAWYLQDIIRGLLRGAHSGWYPFIAGYGMSAILAAFVVLLLFLFRRKYWGVFCSLILYMAIGWWAGDLLLIRLLHLEMNPPRGGTWAACLGLVGGILVCCWRRGLGGVAFSSLSVGFLGGIGFALGAAVKLTVMSSGYDTNWHSVMEQTQGFFFGIAIGLTMLLVRKRSPVMSDQPPVRRWTEVFCVTFVLWLLIYLNFRRSPGEWTQEIQTLKPKLYGIPVVADLLPSRGFIGWLDFVFLAIGFAIVLLLALHLRRPLPFIPKDWLGKGQLLYLIFLWTVVTMNFLLVLPRFTPIRLVTEWIITLNAVACTILLVYGTFAQGIRIVSDFGDRNYSPWIRKTVLLGILGAIVISFAGWGIKRAFWGDTSANGTHADQIRFGPHNTDTVR